MEQQSVQSILGATTLVRKMAALALAMLAIFLLILSVSALRSYHYIGAGIQATNTISVSGEGKVFAVPDTATFSYTVSDTAPDVATAQAKATKDGNAVIDYLKSASIKDADIQTTDYSVNPQYEYSSTICTANGYCPPQKQTISGYQVSQTVSVKVRDTAQAGTILSGVGTRGVSNVSGLDFTVDDEKALEAQARDKAIADAKTQAEALAKSLGVSIVRITGFSENSGGYPVPMYAKADMAVSASGAGATAPSIPVGQNTITSDVSVTYEIR